MSLQRLRTPIIPLGFSSAINKLPLETFDAILSLIDDNPKALTACSLTCQGWVAPAQSRLFRHLRLCRQDDLGNLIQLLDKNPCLGSYIRSLHIRISYPDIGPEDRRIITTRLSRRLTAVQKISVNSGTGLDPLLGTYIATAFPTLRVLELNFFYSKEWDTALPRILLANPKLETLALGMFTWCMLQVPLSSGSRITGPTYLSHVCCCSTILVSIARLLSQKALLRINSLHILGSSVVGGEDQLATVLKGLGSQLECLKLETLVWDRAREGASLASNTRLRKLELGTFMLRGYLQMPRADVGDLVTILSTASPALEEVTIWFWCLDVIDLEIVDWSRLNKIFRGAPSLNCVTLWLPTRFAGGINEARKRIGDWLVGQRKNVLITSI